MVPEGAQAELCEQGKVLNQEEPMQLGHSRLSTGLRVWFVAREAHCVAMCPAQSNKISFTWLSLNISI